MTYKNHFIPICLLASQSLLLLRPVAKAQVYNHDPIRYNNFETNPAYFSSGKYRLTASYLHNGAFYTNTNFSADAIRLSCYNPKYFTGIGLVAGHNQVNGSAGYSYLGLGAAYRTILGNKVYTRVGLLYKLVQTQAPAGIFDYYTFYNAAGEKAQQRTLNNVNASLSFSSAQDKYYLAVAALNLSPKNSLPNPFPVYYAVYIGDLGKLLGLGCEISYSAFLKKYGNASHYLQSHYLSFLSGSWPINRENSLRMGCRLGIQDESSFHFNPAICFYHRNRSRRYILYQLLYDMGIDRKLQLPYAPNYQFNLTYLF